MPTSRNGRNSTFWALVLLAGTALFAACGSPAANTGSHSSVTGVPAVRLSYKYEADVPAPVLPQPAADERNAAVQSDFDTARPGEVLDRTITSPDKKHVLAVYREITDRDSEFRLDAYTPDGKLLAKITSDPMAVHFPDTIEWSPDSKNIAFVAMTRALSGATPTPSPGSSPAAPGAKPTASPDTTATPAPPQASPSPEGQVETPTQTEARPTPIAPTGILTFGSEQIYICGADGEGLKPITQTDGLIYFYYVWSPDSTMLAALAVTAREWNYFDALAAMKGETWTPVGRLRLVEKNGRERRLDDNLTAVQPVFSPDSSKVATAYDTQVRIYDTMGTNPTQAGIPLRNQLLLSSQAYDREEAKKLQGGDVNGNANTNAEPEANANANNAAANSAANANANAASSATTLPDPRQLVSFNPIVEVEWTADDLIYFRTAFIKRMRTEADSVTSYARWHRLALSGQPSATPQ